MKEEFILYPNDNRYKVSNLGRVIGVRGKLLRQPLNSAGYPTVYIKGKMRSVHQVVAETFLNHKPCGYKIVVDHINHEKTDNRVENLRLVTHRANISHQKKNSSSKYAGVHSFRGKWTARIQVNKNREFLGYFDTEIEASNAYLRRLNQVIR